MKILFVGQFQEWSIEHHYVKYLTPVAEVFIYPAEDIFDEYYHPSTWNKVKVKLGVSNIYEKIGRELIDKVEAVQPDIVWVFKGMRILPKALRKIKEMGIKIVTDSIGLYDLHFCYDTRVAARIEKEFNIPTAMLPFGFQLLPNIFQKIESDPEENAASFIGTCDKIRVNHVMQIAEAGIVINVFGSNWDKMLPRNAKNVIVHPPVYGEDFWRNMRKYRLQLNIFRPHNIGSHNMRTFEVPAVGGIMLAPDSPDHRTYFQPDKEIFTYQSKGEMIAKTREVLAMSKTDADAVRQNARERSLSSDYSYERRSKQAFDAFGKLLENG